MKLKLIIAPLMILLIIVIAIWVVAPDYQRLQAQKGELMTAQQKLADIQEKNRKAAMLKKELESNIVQRDIVFTYVPTSAQEESIVENISTLALGEGLSVEDISFTGDTGGNIPAVVDGSGIEVQAPLEKRVILSAKMSGSYEKIRSFLGKLSKLKRYNNSSELKIIPTQDKGDRLSMQMTLNFVYFSGNNSTVVNANSSIFSSGSFDMTTIEQIKTRLSTDIIPINIGETGKPNPFLP